MRATFCVVLVACILAMPARAQSADAPIAVLDRTPLAADSCPEAPAPGSVVLSPDAAVAAAKRLVSAEAKVAVYEKNPPMPWWGVVIIGVVAAGAGAAITAGIYEAAKPRP